MTIFYSFFGGFFNKQEGAVIGLARGWRIGLIDSLNRQSGDFQRYLRLMSLQPPAISSVCFG